MSKPQPRIAIIGAGAGGLTCAIALKQKYGYTNFTIYEREADVGGTWRTHIFPGCASDTSMPFYCLSTELRNWSASHLPQPEILAYWVELAQKHNLYPHIVFNQLVETVEWNHVTQLYDLVLSDNATKAKTEATAHIVISAVGIFETPRYADIPGQDSFKGDLFHSGRWDYSKPLAGRRVGVIGNGASASQFVPVIVQDPSTQVVQFCRTANWILPSLSKQYSVFSRTVFRWFPFLMRLSRWAHFALFEGMYITVFCKRHNAVDTYEALGCKRIVFGANYLEALHSSNIQLNFDGIESIVEDGIMSKTGEHIPLDVLIFATGYAVDTNPVAIKGNKGKTIQEYFAEQHGPKAYLGTAVPGFPNFFLILGPNIATGHSSVVWTNETQVNYIMQLIQPIIEEKVITIEVREDATNAYDAKIQARLSKSVYPRCNSWYRVGGVGKISSVFPGASSTMYMWFRKPNWNHFSGIGAGPFLRRRRWAARFLSLGRVALAIAIAIEVYRHKLHDAGTTHTLKGWIDVGASHFLRIRQLLQGQK